MPKTKRNDASRHREVGVRRYRLFEKRDAGAELSAKYADLISTEDAIAYMRDAGAGRAQAAT